MDLIASASDYQKSRYELDSEGKLGSESIDVTPTGTPSKHANAFVPSSVFSHQHHHMQVYSGSPAKEGGGTPTIDRSPGDTPDRNSGKTPLSERKKKARCAFA